MKIIIVGCLKEVLGIVGFSLNYCWMNIVVYKFFVVIYDYMYIIVIIEFMKNKKYRKIVD